jgi:hypothetical protein
MLGLESSVMARDRQGSSNVACAAASLRPVPPGGRADHRSHRVTLGSACRAQARRTASGAEPMTNRGPAPSPARPWRYPAGGVARAAPGCRAAVCPATSRLARGEGRDRLVYRPGLAAQRARAGAARRRPDVRAGNRGRGSGGLRALESPAASRPCPADPTAGEYGGRGPCGFGLAVPARLAGWSEAGSQARGGEPS